MKRTYIYLLMVFCLGLTSGCSRSFETIRDIRELPQDLQYYVKEDSAARDIVTASERLALQQDYNACFFSPWHQDLPEYDPDDVKRFFQVYIDKMDDGIGKRRRGRSFLKKVVSNARLDGYPNKGLRAITIRYADMKGLPVDGNIQPKRKSRSRKVIKAYSFDKLQVS
ncbi:MAG: NlpC/P60 family N-terminal domain-containing protein, partial [Syntrophales bacterium]|nr:NlpC/P60 family N-terminal domain-containing protein [Syntrophales bacterium]